MLKENKRAYSPLKLGGLTTNNRFSLTWKINKSSLHNHLQVQVLRINSTSNIINLTTDN